MALRRPECGLLVFPSCHGNGRPICPSHAQWDTTHMLNIHHLYIVQRIVCDFDGLC